FRCQGVKLFFVHNKIPVSECIISETGIYTNCGRGSFYTFIERIIGLVFSLIIALVGILGAIYLGLEGHDWLAGTLGTVTIGTLAVAYLKNK
ncbi:hypothetical protein Q7Y31_11125, partial [Glaesserella parasuis]|nr:hypothetical protein [Glaesserella parasuis]